MAMTKTAAARPTKAGKPVRKPAPKRAASRSTASTRAEIRAILAQVNRTLDETEALLAAAK